MVARDRHPYLDRGGHTRRRIGEFDLHDGFRVLTAWRATAPPPSASSKGGPGMSGPPPAFMVVQWMFSHFQTLLKIRSLLDRGTPPDAIAESLKMNAFIFRKEGYLDQARLRSQGQLKKILVRLARLEREMKQGRYGHRFEVELAFAALV